MKTKNNIMSRYLSRIVFPPLKLSQRAASIRTIRVEDYILPAKRKKKERVSERVRRILYDRR